MKKNVTFVFFIFFFSNFAVFSQAQETITIATYYPSPHGVYQELRTQRIAVGQNYFGSTYCWPPAICAHQIDADADLVVEGNVGIGTLEPNNNLDVKGTTRFQTNELNNMLISDAPDWEGYHDNVGLDLVKPESSVPGARILLSGCTSASKNCGEIAFYTNKEDSATIDQAHPRMIIRQDGTVAIGTAGMAVVGSAGTAQLEVSGDVRIGAYTLPSTDGTANQTLVTDGSGTVNWASGVGPDVYTLPGLSCSGSSCSGAATKGGNLKILTGTATMPSAAVNVWVTVSWTNTPFTTIHNAVATVEKTGTAGTNEVGCRLIAGSNNSISIINDVSAGKIHFIVIGE